MKFHLTLDGKNAACGAVANRPDTFLYDANGFSKHYASEYRCKKCEKIFNELKDEHKDNSAHGIADKHKAKIDKQNKNMPDAMRGVMGGGGKINYGGGGVVTNIDKEIASSSLKEELREKLKEHGLNEDKDYIIHFGYTDYGGQFFDKVGIEYFKEKHPDNIVFESTIYSGQNAFVFGEPAKEFAEETREYPLGYEDIEGFYSEMESEQERKDYEFFIEDLKRQEY